MFCECVKLLDTRKLTVFIFGASKLMDFLKIPGEFNINRIFSFIKATTLATYSEEDRWAQSLRPIPLFPFRIHFSSLKKS